MEAIMFLIVLVAAKQSVIFFVSAQIPSPRIVYNVHTRPTHWESARATCAAYGAHLVMAEDAADLEAHLATLDYLDWNNGFTSLLKTTNFWTGLHKSSYSGTNYMTWDPCKTFTDASSPNENIEGDLLGSASSCVSLSQEYHLGVTSCDQDLPFICQLELGNCWFLPVEDKSITATALTYSSGNVHDCASECRNYVETDAPYAECWAFISQDDLCYLYSHQDSHAFVLHPDQFLMTLAGTTSHVKVCTGGWITDTEPRESEPILQPGYQNCSAIDDSDWDSGVCYCDCVEPPTVASPDTLLSNGDAEAEQIAAELVVNPTETSQAQRKLTSADDDRPSAQSLGAFGITILTFVFGGLVLLDLDVLVRHLKRCFVKGNPSAGKTPR